MLDGLLRKAVNSAINYLLIAHEASSEELFISINFSVQMGINHRCFPFKKQYYKHFQLCCRTPECFQTV